MASKANQSRRNFTKEVVGKSGEVHVIKKQRDHSDGSEYYVSDKVNTAHDSIESITKKILSI